MISRIYNCLNLFLGVPAHEEILERLSREPISEDERQALGGMIDDTKLGELLSSFCGDAISLSYATISSTGLQTVADRQFKHINLTGCVSLQDKDIISFIQQSPQIESLDLSLIPITDAVLIALQKYCPHLKTFTHHKSVLIDEGDMYAIAGEIRSMLKRGETLSPLPNRPGFNRAINLIGGEELLFTKRGIEALAQMDLEKLSLFFHPRLDYNELKPLVGKVKHICLPDLRYDKWDPGMESWWVKGTMVGPEARHFASL